MKKKEIIEKDGIQYEVIKIIKKESEKKVIVGPGWDLTQYEKWYDMKYCLEAVKSDGYSLQYVKDQTEAVCLEAVKRNGDSLQYVKDQTEAVCLEAVKSDGYSLRYVNKKVFLNSKKTLVVNKKQED
jgi:hypothetical protein